MAFREVRIYPKTSSDDVGHNNAPLAFTFYMDAVMRGRFKAYSGPEVKGLNIVNLFLYDRLAFEGGTLLPPQSGWAVIMNMYLKETIFDFLELEGDCEEQTGILIDVFTRHAEGSPLPQMQTLVSHIKECRGKISIVEAVKKADEHRNALQERVK